jgi:Family of unknown function (DUF6527)
MTPDDAIALAGQLVRAEVELDEAGAVARSHVGGSMNTRRAKVIEGDRLAFYCPGCDDTHVIHCDGPHAAATVVPTWQWDGNPELPTISPSVLVEYGAGKRCHSFVHSGRIEFLSDCTHKLAGETVDLPVWDAAQAAAGEYLHDENRALRMTPDEAVSERAANVVKRVRRTGAVGYAHVVAALDLAAATVAYEDALADKQAASVLEVATKTYQDALAWYRAQSAAGVAS